MVIVVTPCCKQLAGVTQTVKQVFVQALVPQATVEAFHEAILHRLARCDVVPFHLPVLLPFEHRIRWISSFRDSNALDSSIALVLERSGALCT